MDFAVLNRSSLVSDADASRIAESLDYQFKRDVAPDWGLAAPSVVWYPRGRGVPAGVSPIVLLDDPSVDAAALLGRHEIGPSSSAPVGRVFVRPILAAGGGVLDGRANGDSVSAVASHEGIEILLNPLLNLWADGPLVDASGRAWRQVAREVCDPVQADVYTVPLATRPGAPPSASGTALVSSYVLPLWFAPGARGRVDKLGRLGRALEVGRGGYALVRDVPGSEAQTFGALGNVRPWRAATRRAIVLGA